MSRHSALKVPTILRRFLTPSRRRLGPGGLEPRARGTLWRALAFGDMIVISRALLHFERLERPPGPVDVRMRAAMTLMARTRAPFATPGLHLVWHARHAAVWSWDKTRLGALGASQSAWLVPEPVLDDIMASSAPFETDAPFTLIERRDGYEGQIWQDGELAASRFWARRPDPAEIASFRRAAHSVPEGSEPVHASGASQGASALVIGIRDVAARFRPVHAGAAALLLIGAPLMHAAGSQARLTFNEAAAQRALSAFAEGSVGDFGALERYRDQSAQLDIYRQALERINPLAPAADLAEAAEALDAQVTMLRIEPDRARARIEARGGLDPALLAQVLEARPSLSNVRLTRTANSAAWEADADLVREDAGRPARGGSQ